MQDYSKEIPPDLRNALRSDRATHQDGLAHLPIAGPSQGSFREATSQEQQRRTNANAEFNLFSYGAEPSVRAASTTPVSSDTAWRPHWSGDVLRPRPEDSAAVQALLDQPDNLDTEDTILQDVTDNQQLPWRSAADSKVPADPAVPSTEGGSYRQADYPYLFSLLNLPEHESMATYLNNTSYTDDVWALPLDIKREMDVLRNKQADDNVKARALRRLEMLKSHIFTRNGATTPGQTPRTLQDADWNAIWSQVDR